MTTRRNPKITCDWKQHDLPACTLMPHASIAATARGGTSVDTPPMTRPGAKLGIHLWRARHYASRNTKSADTRVDKVVGQIT